MHMVGPLAREARPPGSVQFSLFAGLPQLASRVRNKFSIFSWLQFSAYLLPRRDDIQGASLLAPSIYQLHREVQLSIQARFLRMSIPPSVIF